MIFSKQIALDLCHLNEQSYVLANTGHCQLPEGFSAPQAIRMGADGRPFLLQKDPLDIWGFTTTRNGILHIVWRGTQITSGIDFAQEWAEDALSLPLQATPKGHVHLGFYGAWKAVKQPLIAVINGSSMPKIITGHSLGAAIATLCWAELGGDLMTFASPRVGDPEFGTALWTGQTVRIANKPDLVPKVPMDPPFRHGGQEIMLNGEGEFKPQVAHDLLTYESALKALP